MTTHGFSESFAFSCSTSNVPDSHSFIKRVGHKIVTIMRDFKRPNSILMSLNTLLHFLLCHIVAFNIVFNTSVVYFVAVVAETHAGEWIFSLHYPHLLLTSGLPNSQWTIITYTCYVSLSLLRTWDWMYYTVVSLKLTDYFSSLNVPNAHCFVSWPWD